MNKIAIISDIHSNLTALEAVLKDIKNRGITKIFCLGDSVTKGPNPNKVVDLLKEHCKVIVKGNCDELISNPAINADNWTTKQLGKNRLDFLYNLPIIHEFYISGYFVRLFHASPVSIEHIFNPMFSNSSTKYSELEITDPSVMFENTEFIGKTQNDKVPDIIGYGHIHTPNLFKFKNKTIFNPGSVGFPIEMAITKEDYMTSCFSTLASYIILEGNYESKTLSPISFTSVRIPYDVEKEIQEIKNSTIPSKEERIHWLRTATS